MVELQQCKMELQHKDQNEKRLENQIEEKDGVIATLRSTVASLEQRSYIQNEVTSIELQLEVTESWKTFRMNLSTSLMKLGLAEAPAAVDADDGTPLSLFRELHKTAHSYVGPKYEKCIKGKEEEYEHRLEELMERWNEDFGFQTDSSQVLSQLFFYLIANQLYRIGGKSKVCPVLFQKAG